MDEGSAFETTVRLAAFFGIFAAMAVWEILAPRRPKRKPVSRRWVTNMGIVVVDIVLLRGVGLLVANAIVLRVLFPATAVASAVWAAESGFGLFNTSEGLNGAAVPGFLAGAIAFVFLDFAVWLEHVVSHKIPILWRIHRVHHADIDLDVTSGLRFHPLEIILSMGWKAGLVALMGAPVLSVLVFEVVLNGMAMFNHSNARIPLNIDRLLRWLVVTPDMHRTHHSIIRRETDSNYGFNLSVWDRLFGVYTEMPEKGHDGMVIGLAEHQDEKPAGLLWSLAFPFRKGR